MSNTGGFSAIVGNPPYLGGQKLSGTYGLPFREFLVNVVAQKSGSIDLGTYFLISIFNKLEADGAFGVVATNTIAQGVNREIGLESILEKGGIITDAKRNKKWGEGASVVVHLLTVSNGNSNVDPMLDGELVTGINSMLEDDSILSGTPVKLSQNANICFQGSVILGDGFMLTPEERAQFVAQNPRNSEVIKPCMGGRDLGHRPDGSASRYVIDFGHLTVNQAMAYPELYSRVETMVKPERDVNKSNQRRLNWWKFGAQAKKLYEQIANLDTVIAVPETSTFCKMRMVHSDQVFMHSLKVFATNNTGFYGVLLSTVHDLWVNKYTATLGSGRRYQPTSCFETFPFPSEENMQLISPLAVSFDELRSSYMMSEDIGITECYNRINDPRNQDSQIQELRNAIVKLDLAVIRSYGWNDLVVHHQFTEFEGKTNWSFPTELQNKILQNLLEINLDHEE